MGFPKRQLLLSKRRQDSPSMDASLPGLWEWGDLGLQRLGGQTEGHVGRNQFPRSRDVNGTFSSAHGSYMPGNLGVKQQRLNLFTHSLAHSGNSTNALESSPPEWNKMAGMHTFDVYLSPWARKVSNVAFQDMARNKCTLAEGLL